MNKLLKLAKALLKFAEISTDNGTLTVNEDLAVGIEVFVEDENGEFVPAADGEYLAEDKKITVKDGKIEEIEVIEQAAEEPKEEPAAEEPKEEPVDAAKCKLEGEEPAAEPDEKDVKIAELEGLLKDRDAVIEELTAKIKELEDKIAKPVEEPVEMKSQIQEKLSKVYENPALKYFQ